jgi:hypothetical protein
MRACSDLPASFGTTIADKTPKITTTNINSIKVKALFMATSLING